MTPKAKTPRLFTCPRHEGSLRITKAFCAQSWQRAKTYTDPEDRTRLGACLGCTTGSRNAQGAEAPSAPLDRSRMWTISPAAGNGVPLKIKRTRTR